MQLNPVASTVIVVAYLATSLILIGLLVAMILLLLRVSRQMDDYAGRVDPVLTKAETALTALTDRIGTIGDRTESLLTHGEAVVETVQDRVDRTSSAVQKTINTPLIGINSLAAGVTRGLSTFSRLQRHNRLTGSGPSAYYVPANGDGAAWRDDRESYEPRAETTAMRIGSAPAGVTTGKE